MTVETGAKRKIVWLRAGVVALLVVLAAATGVALRLYQTKDAEQRTEGLPAAVTDLEKLRDSGDQAAFDAKLKETLNDGSLDSETRYLVYIEQGHNALQAGKSQEAINAYAKAWQLKQDKQAAALLGAAYAASGDKTRAIEFYNKAISLIPADYPNPTALKKEYENRIRAIEEGTSLDD